MDATMLKPLLCSSTMTHGLTIAGGKPEDLDVLLENPAIFEEWSRVGMALAAFMRGTFVFPVDTELQCETILQRANFYCDPSSLLSRIPELAKELRGAVVQASYIQYRDANEVFSRFGAGPPFVNVRELAAFVGAYQYLALKDCFATIIEDDEGDIVVVSASHQTVQAQLLVDCGSEISTMYFLVLKP